METGKASVLDRIGGIGWSTVVSRLDCLCGSVVVTTLCFTEPEPGTFTLARWCGSCQRTVTSSWHSSGPQSTEVQ